MKRIWRSDYESIESPNVTFKDGIIYWKRDNGKVIKIGGSGCGKTRFFKKPNLRSNQTSKAKE